MANVDIVISTIDKTQAGIKSAQGGIEGLAKSYKAFMGAAAAVTVAVVALRKAFDETVGATVDYANSVRQMSQITGESAEETSRLIQVTDDYKIGVQQLEMAQRQLALKGYGLTTDSLAELSDAYLKLNSGAERQKFLTDYLGGRSGQAFAEIMLQGGEAIRAQGDAIADNLILSNANLKAAREYELQVDALNDSWQGVKITVGNELLPILTDAGNFLEDRIREMQLHGGQISDYIGNAARAAKEFTLMKRDMFPESKAWSDFQIAVIDFFVKSGDKADMFRAAIDEAEQAATELASKIQEVYASEFSGENQVNFLVEYAQKYDDVQQQIADNEVEIARLRKAGYTDADPEMQKLLGQQAALKGSMEEYVNTMLFGFAQAVVLADGLVTSEELAKLGGLGVELGIFSPEAWAEAEGALRTFTTDAQGIVDEALGTTAENAKATWKTAADEVTRMVQAIPDVIEVTVRKGGDEGRGGSRRGDGGDGGATGFASGGQLRGGRWSVVGERGWELISPTGYVYPHEQSKRMAGRVGGARGFAEGGQLGDGGESLSALFDRFIRANAVAIRDAVQMVM